MGGSEYFILTLHGRTVWIERLPTLNAQRSTLNAQRSTLNAQRSTLKLPHTNSIQPIQIFYRPYIFKPVLFQ